MGTDCLIGRENTDGTVTAIFCAHDSQPPYVGATLRDHYTGPEKVDALMALGSVSVLGSDIGEKHKFGRGPNDWCEAYGRDRGEDGAIACAYSAARFACKADDFCCLYLYSLADKAWFCRSNRFGDRWLTIDAAIAVYEAKRK